MRDYPYICGQLIFDNSLDSLDTLFQDCSLIHEIRKSAHFHDGNYLKVSLNNDTELKFEKIDSNEFLISGEANNQIDLSKLAEITSTILSDKKLKHRLELYNTDNNEYGYYNYEWTK